MCVENNILRGYGVNSNIDDSSCISRNVDNVNHGNNVNVLCKNEQNNTLCISIDDHFHENVIFCNDDSVFGCNPDVGCSSKVPCKDEQNNNLCMSTDDNFDENVIFCNDDSVFGCNLDVGCSSKVPCDFDVIDCDKHDNNDNGDEREVSDINNVTLQYLSANSNFPDDFIFSHDNPAFKCDSDIVVDSCSNTHGSVVYCNEVSVFQCNSAASSSYSSTCNLDVNVNVVGCDKNNISDISGVCEVSGCNDITCKNGDKAVSFDMYCNKDTYVSNDSYGNSDMTVSSDSDRIRDTTVSSDMCKNRTSTLISDMYENGDTIVSSDMCKNSDTTESNDMFRNSDTTESNDRYGICDCDMAVSNDTYGEIDVIRDNTDMSRDSDLNENGDSSAIGDSNDSDNPFDSEYHDVSNSCNASHIELNFSSSDFNDNVNSNEFSPGNILGNTHTTLSCMALNVGGLRSKLDFPSFITFVKSYDIIVITESKFSDTDSVQIDGFTPFYKNRSKFKRRSGGILLLVRNVLVPWVNIIENIQMKNKISDNQDRYIFVNYDISSRALFFTIDPHILGKKILFCGSYIEGDNSSYFNRQAYAELEENLVNINCEHICLLGDLNSRSGNLDDVLISNYHSDIGVELMTYSYLIEYQRTFKQTLWGTNLFRFVKLTK